LDDISVATIELGNFFRLQEETDSVLRVGTGNVHGQTVSAEIWFIVLRFWLDLIRRALWAKTAGMSSLVDLIPAVAVQLPDPVFFEGLRTVQRLAVLDRVGWLLSLPVEKVGDLMRTAGLSKQNLMGQWVTPIDAVLQIAETLPSRKGPIGLRKRAKKRSDDFPTPRSRRRVEWLMKKLRQKAAVRN
jgi:hypothetical protein